MRELQTVLRHVNKVTLENAESIFRNIATRLFREFCIMQGNVIYKFLEVEFYYFGPEHKDVRISNGNPFVYKRNCKNAGSFFVHSSGVDICFETTDNNACYGGILIRSLLRIGNGSNMVVTGPWDCLDALINYTDNTNYPRITRMSVEDSNVEIESARRYHDEDCVLQKEYCFYNKRYQKDNQWTLEKEPLKRYDPANLEPSKSPYPIKPWNRK